MSDRPSKPSAIRAAFASHLQKRPRNPRRVVLFDQAARDRRVHWRQVRGATRQQQRANREHNTGRPAHDRRVTAAHKVRRVVRQMMGGA